MFRSAPWSLAAAIWGVESRKRWLFQANTCGRRPEVGPSPHWRPAGRNQASDCRLDRQEDTSRPAGRWIRCWSRSATIRTAVKAGTSRRWDGRNLLQFVSSETHVCYISTTGVYHQCNGCWVDETSPTRPRREGGRVHLWAEELLRRHRSGSPWTILRLAGIYGPNRIRGSPTSSLVAPSRHRRTDSST